MFYTFGQNWRKMIFWNIFKAPQFHAYAYFQNLLKAKNQPDTTYNNLPSPSIFQLLLTCSWTDWTLSEGIWNFFCTWLKLSTGSSLFGRLVIVTTLFSTSKSGQRPVSTATRPTSIVLEGSYPHDSGEGHRTSMKRKPAMACAFFSFTI